MITIIGHTPEELAALQSVINTGILNSHDISKITLLNTKYELLSKNLILTDEYGNIVGEIRNEQNK